MPRLLRVHFASVGHPDARLAPVTLDLCNGSSDEGVPAGDDTVVWLRNGGGKSSMLNLLFSVFLPNMREFLGTTAEGKKQRFDDYIQASDLGFIITQWDLSETETRPLFDDLDLPSRVVGRMVAWPNQHKSADASNLKHLYFSFKTSPDIQFESLPVQGLGDPLRSFEDFRRWLFDLREAKPNLDVFYTELQRDWRNHLESIHLDPEMFRYLVQMNRNEGDAESLFRHKTAKDFVRFFLEMTLDPSHASRVVSNLDELKKQLRGRPKRVLESNFLHAVLTQFEPFAAEVARHREALSRLDQLRLDGSALIVALGQSRQGLDEKARLEDTRAVDAAKKQREYEQCEVQAGQQAAWLRHRAAQLDLEEAETEFDQAKVRQDQAETRVRVVEAAKCLQRVRELEAQKRALNEAQRIGEEGRAPLRQATELAGACLARLLNGALTSTREKHVRVRQGLANAKEAKDRLLNRVGELQSEAGRLAERAANFHEQIERRDRAVTRLVDRCIIERGEVPVDASLRWAESANALARQLDSTRQKETQNRQWIDNLRDEMTSLKEAFTGVEQECRQRESDFNKAVRRRNQLSIHPRIVDLEEVERADLESPGLVARLTESTHAADSRLFKLRMKGAENEHALESIERTQLLPPSRDVEIVVRELRTRKIPAHSFLAYLADHLSPDDVESLLVSDPGRFAGVGVPTANWLKKVQELGNRLPGLRSPVQVSLLTLSHEGESGESVVLAPDERGAYCLKSAQSARHRLEAEELDRTERQEQLISQRAEVGGVIHKVTEFLDQYGSGKLGELESSVSSLRQQGTELRERIEATKQNWHQAKDCREALAALVGELQESVQTATSNCQQIDALVAEHEDGLTQIRNALEETRRRQSELATDEQLVKDQLATFEREMVEFQTEIRQHEFTIRDIDKEIDAVRYQADGTTPTGAVSLEEARAEYSELDRKLDRELSNDRTQGRLDQLEPELVTATQEYSSAGTGLAVREVEACRDAGQLDNTLTKARKDASHLAELRGKAEASLELARQSFRHLEESDEQRKTLPVAGDVKTAAKAEELASEFDQECVEHRRNKEEAEKSRGECEANAAKLRTRSEGRRHHEEMLRVLVKNSTDAEPASLSEDDAELTNVLAEYRVKFDDAQQTEEQLDTIVRRRLAGIRLAVDDQKFAEHQDQIKVRLRSEESVLMDQAEPMLQRLRERLHVTAELLSSLEKHRVTVLSAVHELAMDAKRLLESIERVSVMPDGFDAWTGQPFLRVRLPAIGKTPEERMARLEPLVDRIIEDADLPDGVRLATQAVESLLGGRDFDVTLLKPKPKGTRQSTRHPIANLASFSEGEKLTVAVLLFCTLVRLRARNRPAGQDGAKVLVLDNPFGKCNYPEFIKQQLAIANQLNIQLVYTTGVDDLGALSYFPNRIKLKNTTRNRLTGFSHVTHDEEGVVTSIRVARREAVDGST